MFYITSSTHVSALPVNSWIALLAFVLWSLSYDIFLVHFYCYWSFNLCDARIHVTESVGLNCGGRQYRRRCYQRSFADPQPKQEKQLWRLHTQDMGHHHLGIPVLWWVVTTGMCGDYRAVCIGVWWLQGCVLRCVVTTGLCAAVCGDYRAVWWLLLYYCYKFFVIISLSTLNIVWVVFHFWPEALRISLRANYLCSIYIGFICDIYGRLLPFIWLELHLKIILFTDDEPYFMLYISCIDVSSVPFSRWLRVLLFEYIYVLWPMLNFMLFGIFLSVPSSRSLVLHWSHPPTVSIFVLLICARHRGEQASWYRQRSRHNNCIRTSY